MCNYVIIYVRYAYIYIYTPLHTNAYHPKNSMKSSHIGWLFSKQMRPWYESLIPCPRRPDVAVLQHFEGKQQHFEIMLV